MPSFIKNGMKGVRFATEGALNSKGVPIVEDINAYSSIMQIFGFTPATLSEAYARAGARKTAEQAINNRKTALLDALYLAKSTGDIEGEMDMYEKIDAFNLRHPEKEISAKSMKRSEDMHEKALTQYTDGVRLDPKLKDYLIETRN
jgi:hypothetical protein